MIFPILDFFSGNKNHIYNQGTETHYVMIDHLYDTDKECVHKSSIIWMFMAELPILDNTYIWKPSWWALKGPLKSETASKF